jgi:hypothetical protein
MKDAVRSRLEQGSRDDDVDSNAVDRPNDDDRRGVARRYRIGRNDDASPLLSRRQWLGPAWSGFTATSLVALATTGRMAFPNVLDEPSQQCGI